jgi:TetR/AcrR family transcriptional regulator of autoinduction and epiphytic fitness
MPLPRFHRLSDEQKTRILRAAREHIAAHGADASYNQIIADAGISKASAYHYFDGKADLFSEVRRALDAELAAVIGPWSRARSAKAFWAQLRRESARLRAHLVDRAGDLRALAVTRGDAPDTVFDPWFDALIDNGVELGLVRDDLDRSLVRDATRALFSVFDARAIAALHAGACDDNDDDAWELLRALWAPRRPKRGAS